MAVPAAWLVEFVEDGEMKRFLTFDKPEGHYAGCAKALVTENWTREDLAEGLASLDNTETGPEYLSRADDLLAHLSLCSSQRFGPQPTAWLVGWDENPYAMFAKTQAEADQVISNLRAYAKGVRTNLRATPLYKAEGRS